MSPPHLRRVSPLRDQRLLFALPAFGLLLIAALWAATWLQLQLTRSTMMAVTTRDTENVAAQFERYTLGAIKDADRIARLVKHEFEQYGTLDLPRLIRLGLVDGNGLVQVSIANAQGDLIASSQPLNAINIGDREYFQLHAKQRTELLDISKPIVGRSSGRTLIQLSRRINHRDGTFAGIVLLSVTSGYLMEFYRDADLGKQGSLGLLGLDGIYRARRVGGTATSAPDESGARLVAHAENRPVGHFEAQSDIDGVLRIVAYRKLADYPLIVTAAQATEEALAEFRQIRDRDVTIAAAATLVIMLFFAVVTVLAVRLQRSRTELKVQRHFLETLVDTVPAGITVRSMRPDIFGQYVLWNESNTLMTGIKPEEALGKTTRDLVPGEYPARIMELDRTMLASPMVQDVVETLDLRDKGRRTYHLIRTPIFGAEGQLDYIMTSATDITEERARTDELRLASKVFETAHDGIMVSDTNDRVVMVNAAFSQLTGYQAQEIVGKILAESPFRPVDVAESNARMEMLHRDGFVTGEVPRFHKDGSPLPLWITASCVRNADDTVRNYVRVFTDISLLKETQKKLEQLASFDALTGLPNRRLLHDRLEQALLRARRHQVCMGLMFIDLDGFKDVNDTLGHGIGDLLLREVAVRLARCVRASDSIGRFGGDEFAIVLEDACLPADAKQVGERIVAALATPFSLNGHCVRVTASIGIAMYPPDGADATTLLQNADVAMYHAKRSGRNRFEFFTEAEETAAVVA